MNFFSFCRAFLGRHPTKFAITNKIPKQIFVYPFTGSMFYLQTFAKVSNLQNMRVECNQEAEE